MGLWNRGQSERLAEMDRKMDVQGAKLDHVDEAQRTCSSESRPSNKEVHLRRLGMVGHLAAAGVGCSMHAHRQTFIL